MKMEIFVMPAWIAGIQVRRMRPETSMSAWIPALHAGMTQSRRGVFKVTEVAPPYLQRSVSCTRAHLERMKMEERRGKKGWWPREKIDQ